MKQRSELVQFISRAFGAAAIALLVGTGVFVALTSRRNEAEARATRSREVTRLARETEVAALQRHSALHGYILVGGPISPEALGVGDRRMDARLDSLRRLTIGDPSQQVRADRLTAIFARWDSTLARSAPLSLGRPVESSEVRAALRAAESIFATLSAEVDAFLQAEEQLYHDRSEAARRLDRVVSILAVVSLLIILGTLYLLRRRLLAQAHDVSVTAAALDLRNAQLIDQTREMEQMIDALQASEARFRTLVDSLHDVVFTLGHEKRFTGMYGGQAAPEALAGYIGKTAVEVLGPGPGQVHLDAADRALAGETVRYDWTMGDGGDARFYSVTVSPLRGPSGEIRGVVGLNRDVTEQVVGERALSEAREQLRQSQRIEALGQLAGGVAHDFNNLLTIIMTYSAILQEETPANSDQARSLDEIQFASERAAALTRQLLAFSRRQVLRPRAIDLNDTLREVERMLRRVLPADVALETQLDASLGDVMADPAQIEQVLVNLAVNARDAMPDGGRLTMSTARVERGDDRPGGPGMGGPHVLVTVSDTGVGMSPETVARLFEPFFTTKELGKGSGLGLATVHGIVEQSGGRVSVESDPGRGTRFFIRLPLASGPSAMNDPAVRDEIDHRGSETVLLVDDNEELRRVVKRMLARAGYTVVEAANGAAALAHLDQGAAVDIVISDVMMPEMNGRAVLDAVRQRHRGVRLLFMSGYNYDTALRGMAQRGDVMFIEKPFTAEQLLQKLREVLGQPLERGAA